MLLELRVVRICVRYRFCLEIIIFRWLYRGREKYSEDGATTFGESRRFEMWFPASAPSVPAPSTLHSYPASSLYRFLLNASLHSRHLQNVLYDRWPRY